MKLKDTLSQTFKYIDSKQPVIQIYSCGPTVYDYPHLGNWYAFLRWDLLIRALKLQDYTVNWVMNITDVGHLASDADEGEDKLVQKARQERKTAQEIAQYYTEYFLHSLQKLNFIMPNHLPKATEYIDQQIDLIKKLESQGVTYMINDGLYYDTSKLPDYGKLAQLNRQGFKSTDRIDFNEQKRHLTDFALWKLSPKKQKRDMEWDSPWGRGFPGWHAECSAMSEAHFNLPIDIHTGGIDHIPIHHTNELAQSEVAYQKPLAKIWLHSNFITVEGQKMAKSKANFYTLEDLLKANYDLESFRLAVFSSRYSKAVDFNWQLLDQAQKRFQRWQNMIVLRFQTTLQAEEKIHLEDFKQLKEICLENINDNLNSPAILEVIDKFSHQLTIPLSENLKPALEDLGYFMDNLLGLSLMQIPDISIEQKEKLDQRHKARQDNDFENSDRLRRELLEQGISILDTEFGQIWQLN
ncbi:MAG: cysteine--tRNA ligase [Candidatus Saccharibacteria bacterium]|nr:cysteine--tRNA ligase [Candidatus Saccharibacteria bacterium]